MFLFHLFFLVSLGVGLLLAQRSAFSGPSGGPSCPLPRLPSDGYLLTLQWPISFCYKAGRCSLSRPLHRWIIHGLWPQFNATNRDLAAHTFGSPYPQYCCHPQVQVDLAQLPAPLSAEMRQIWPSLKVNPRGSPQSAAFSFWRHQWSKHGSCARNPQDGHPFTPESYFGLTVQLYGQYPLQKWLSSHGIHPSNERAYSVRQIHRALEDASGFSSIFRLECDRPRGGDRRGPAILGEIQICLDLKLKPIDCAHLYREEGDFSQAAFDDSQCGSQVMLLEE